jgi:hypothetical protein
MRLFVLSVLLVVTARQPALASVDDTLLALAPSSTKVLTGIDVKRAATSRAGSYILNETLTDEGVATLARTTGLNVRRDIRQMLYVGLEQQSAANLSYVLIAHGAFDAPRLIAVARSKGASVRQYRGSALLVLNTGKSASGVAFPRAGIVFFGDLATVEAVLSAQPSSPGVVAALREQVARIGPANDMWFATLLSGSFLVRQTHDSLPPPMRNSELLDGISRSLGGLRFGKNDQITLDLIARTASDARLLSGLLHVGGSLAHLQIGGSAELSLAESVLSSMQVSVEGSTVHATSTLADEQLERALVSGK